MKKLHLIIAIAIVATPLSLWSQDADQILDRARLTASLQHRDLLGHISKDGRKTDLALFLRGENIQFQFLKKNQWEKFHMRLNEDHYNLFSFNKKGKAVRFNTDKLGHYIAKTDLSYEDLALRFLYWPNGKVVGQERLKTRKAWKIRLVNPGKGGRYRIVYVWVDQKTGALMKVIGYNAQGLPLKKFQVTDVMNIGGGEYTLRRMRVDSINPKTTRSLGVTYLEFNKPKKVAPGRLR